MANVCRQCGRHNPDGAQFCANSDCGAFLGWEADDATPGPVSVNAEPLRTAAPQNAAAGINLSDTTLQVEPGATVETTATVRNGGSQVEEFVLIVVGPAAPWATIEPARLQVYPGQAATAVIRLAPPRRPDTQPGTAWFTVRAASTLHRGLTADAQGSVTVGAYRELSATLTPQQARGRGATAHTVEVTNTGNVIEPVRLVGSDPTGTLMFDLGPDERQLPPGSQRVGFHVRPPGKWLGQSKRYPFNVIVVPREPAQPIRLDGDRELIPRIAGWVPKAAAGLVAIALLLGAYQFVLKPRLAADPTPGPSVSTPAPTPDASKAPSASPSASPSPSASKSQGPPPFADPKVTNANCFNYPAEHLTITDQGATGWTLDESGSGTLLTFDTQADAEAGLQVASRYQKLCWIGANNTRPDHSTYVVEYWLGQDPKVPFPPENGACTAYDKKAVHYQAAGANGFALFAGEQQLLGGFLDTEQDAKDAVTVASAYSKLCAIGQWNVRPDHFEYVTYYWIP
ncbi:hypothetical protein Afil01_51550 [Actinorhabdospora filicis]|uniref:Uncharacterized protein n=1 Tax=Actinorhabdospora filicis TaxID=1785913 RepID=A0A9W6WBR7_9ACTN|nr:zinc ribbon domain-containing protein [Actinorhabdospora filicis]GLZ80348.1 hypothetical protein Afil01_51550 [Actinorhabdospora filicis]